MTIGRLHAMSSPFAPSDPEKGNWRSFVLFSLVRALMRNDVARAERERWSSQRDRKRISVSIQRRRAEASPVPFLFAALRPGPTSSDLRRP